MVLLSLSDCLILTWLILWFFLCKWVIPFSFIGLVIKSIEQKVKGVFSGGKGANGRTA